MILTVIKSPEKHKHQILYLDLRTKEFYRLDEDGQGFIEKVPQKITNDEIQNIILLEVWQTQDQINDIMFQEFSSVDDQIQLIKLQKKLDYLINYE